ncbi:Amino acid permease, putative isoform 1 [Hibiscus syriacus]|uniref:Amino acid permease, putative isoform 1 n=1 Tax=Hibiscus syriacus TaxID=106335 RepID=A0A6A3BCG7_HIBSY|nr:Amino acid permease, putative isoform 1 [Hibiscus syriacus]
MGRIPCCENGNVKRGQWTPEEDNKLSSTSPNMAPAIGVSSPRMLVSKDVGKAAGCDGQITFGLTLSTAISRMLRRRPLLDLILWSLIATQLPGRTDDIKNHWKHQAEEETFRRVAHLAEAALGCFKDEMLHLLTKKRIDFQLQQPNPTQGNNTTVPCVSGKQDEKDDAVEKIKVNLSRAIQEPDMLPMNKPWGSSGSPWSQSMCTGSTCTAAEQVRSHEKLNDENRKEIQGGKELPNASSIFDADCVLWDIPSDDLINPIYRETFNNKVGKNFL